MSMGATGSYEVRRNPYAGRTQQLSAGGLVELLGDNRATDAVDLATGTPSSPPTSDRLIAAACSALRSGSNQYEDPKGNRGLRRLISDSLTTPADPEQEITITVGGTEALLVALLAVIDPGDEVIVFEPYYDNFLGPIALAGAVPRFVPLREPDWRFDGEELAAAFGARTKAVILNTPHNPTGRMFDREELELLSTLCAMHDVAVVSDEVYSAFTFDDRAHVSVADLPSLAGRSIVVGSLSKSHALSGWRVGFLRAPAELTRVLRKVHIATTGGTTAPLQQALLDSGVLLPGAWTPAPALQKSRDRVAEMFDAVGVRCRLPQGGCYIMADIRTATRDDSTTYAARLLAECGVLVVPSSVLYSNPADGASFVRIAFNKSKTVIEEAAIRLSRLSSPLAGGWEG